ncbi:MAG: nucleotidyltransferase domain-containing protein [Planctomycetes bacterium]|nr:nucleotidyltransferase domain-containing protein [Planctomycetota bacterium]
MHRRESEQQMNAERELASLLSRHASLRLAILFGSAAAGRQRPDSDVDVAVAGARGLSPQERIELIGELAQLTGRAVDLVDLTIASGTVLSRVLTTGRLLFCSDHTLYAELIKKALYDDADLERYRQRILGARRDAWIGA